MRIIKRSVKLWVGALAGLLAAGCAGGGTPSPQEGEVMIPQIDLERPAVTETATFALG